MRCCPICREAPQWHYCRNVTWREKKENHFSLAPACQHQIRFCAGVGIVADSLRSLKEAQWDQEAEKQFAEYTSTWTDVQRTAFRAEIWPPKPAREETYQDNVPWR